MRPLPRRGLLVLVAIVLVAASACESSETVTVDPGRAVSFTDPGDRAAYKWMMDVVDAGGCTICAAPTTGDVPVQTTIDGVPVTISHDEVNDSTRIESRFTTKTLPASMPAATKAALVGATPRGRILIPYQFVLNCDFWNCRLTISRATTTFIAENGYTAAVAAVFIPGWAGRIMGAAASIVTNQFAKANNHRPTQCGWLRWFRRSQYIAVATGIGRRNYDDGDCIG